MTFLRLPLLCLLLSTPVWAGDDDAFDPPTSLSATATLPSQLGMFPFVLPAFDDEKTATDVSWMNSAPAGADGFVKTEGERFVDGKGQTLRFWGVNLNFNGVFPPKDQAPKVAARLAKFGFNAVRIHHFDGNAAPNGIWKSAGSGSSRLKLPREFDPEQIDRFDFFMAELIKRGIYVNLNLHVGRKVYLEEGFPRASFLPEKDKGVNYFDDKLIEAQQNFSRQILKRLNPYTGRTYADEPGVCAVEVTNENSLLGMWLDGTFSKIPEPYSKNLRDKWNAWLKAKYSSEEALRAAWTELDDPLHRDDVLGMPYPIGIVNPNAPDARLDIGLASLRRFKFKSDSGATAEVDVDALGGPAINGFVRPGLSAWLQTLGNEKWGFQINRDGLDLKDGRAYSLSFWARSDNPRRISINLWQDQQPFEHLGFTGFADLSTEWQQYSFVFRPQNPEPNHARLNFNFGNAPGTVQLAETMIHEGGRLAAPAGWTLKNGVPLIEHRTTQVWNARRDFAQFLGEVESAYVARMRVFLKTELGVRCPIWNTQGQFGGWGGLWRESQSDALDVHAYWKHPVYENGGWSGTNWKVENASMTAAPAIDPLSGFSFFRLKGKPFVMSEWNSGQPNDFGGESLLMIAAYAAWQDWAGVYVFDYHSNGNYDRDYMRGFFSIDSHPAKMATAPAAALIFRRLQGASTSGAEATLQEVSTRLPAQGEARGETSREEHPAVGDVFPSRRETKLTIPPDWLWLKVAGSSGQPTPALVLPAWKEAGAPRFAPLQGKVYAQFGDVPFAVADRANGVSPDVFVSDTGQIKWSKKPSVFTLNTPQSKMAVGFLGGFRVTLGEWRLEVPREKNNFAVLALSSLDGLELARSKRVLLTAVGKAENIGMGWNAARNSVGSNWGKGPTLVEGVGATFRLLTDHRNIRVYALGPTGQRASPVPVVFQNGKLFFSISPRFRTVWYEIAVEE